MNKLFIAAVLLGTSPAYAQSATDFLLKADANRPAEGLTYTMTVTSPEGTISYQAAQKGAKWRMQGEQSGISALILFDGKEVTVSSMGMAFKDKSIPNYSALPTEDATFILGEETIKNSIPCRMISKNDGTAELCVSEQYGLSVYTKSDGMQMDITDIQPKKLDDSFFTLPSNTQIIELNALQFGM